MANDPRPPSGDWFGTGEFSRDPSRWDPAVHGYIDGYGNVTFQPGVGPNQGHTLIRDGHVQESDFNGSSNHNHYDGDGGARDSGSYNGPGH